MFVAVVDDRESSHVGFTQILRRLPDVEPMCFSKPDDALHWLGGTDPIFVVVDYFLSDTNGLDFIRRMRQIPGRATTPIIVTSAKSDRDVRRAAFELDVYAFLEKPINPTEFLSHAANIVRNVLTRVDLERRLAEAMDRARHAVHSTDATARDGEELALAAMRAVAVHHDPTIATHMDLAAKLARALAKQMKLPDDEIEAIAGAARIYDIGKVAIPQRILELREKATGPDRITIEHHADIGARILFGYHSTAMKTAAVMASTHHERFDGSGYPRKLRGAAIPIAGRIGAVADVLSAMLRPRGDRPAATLGEAMTYVDQNAGSQFDPAVATAMRAGISDISRIVHEATTKATTAT